ncbi:MAG: glycoside hydrolase family 31 protein, partial [Eubacteriales bacterium]|nr:glycoside hydrolase family 31 protein [Eubacteriales bacterium]
NANVRFEQDEHFKNDAVRMDRITVPGQPWFGHLKKFVDQGVSAFKLDGAYMVLDHPDRLYGNGMTDGEMHNLYPVLLNKQMARGFTEHTGRRAMIYSAGGYTGIQRYSATWAGDTGGGFEPLVSMLNHGLSGHSNTSCDMDVFSVESIHFGFLQPWSQLNSWNYWRHPWLLADEDKEIFRDYAKLRYAFVPYLYTAAHIANRTGMPVMRAMPLIYPDGGFDDCMNQYMLGDSLLVCTFPKGRCMTLRMPEGKWHDFFTGEIYTGPAEIKYDIPEGKGGALLVKDGSVIPMAQPRKFIGDKPYDSYILHVYGRRARGMLYSDDGITPRYLEGEYVISDISAELKGGRLEISVSSEGGYAGMPEEVTYTAVTHGFGAEETLIDG